MARVSMVVTMVILSHYFLDVIFLKFYFIAFQYLCHVEGMDQSMRYPPVEMALMEYSLKEGRQKVWHTLIHPGEEQAASHASVTCPAAGKVPTGFRYQAKLHCKSVSSCHHHHRHYYITSGTNTRDSS